MPPGHSDYTIDRWALFPCNNMRLCPGRLLLAVALCAIAHVHLSAAGGDQAMRKVLVEQQGQQQGIWLMGDDAELRHDDVLEILSTSEVVEPHPPLSSPSFSPSSLPSSSSTWSRIFAFRNRAGSSNSFTRPSSVVSDYVALCEQLCGAGLGGKHCALFCPVVESHERKLRFYAMVKQNGDAICEDLCKLQLGDPVCNCSGSVNIFAHTLQHLCEPRGILVAFTAACSSFCDRNRLTLNGCTKCRAIELADGGAANVYNALVLVTSEDNATTAATRSLVMAVDLSKIVTPNWHELCASLCKTGDGGSLCNCDLSPFFF